MIGRLVFFLDRHVLADEIVSWFFSTIIVFLAPKKRGAVLMMLPPRTTKSVGVG